MPLINTLGGSSAGALGGLGGAGAAPPENTVAPVLSGTAAVGATLTSTDGTWNSPSGGTITFTYQWYNNTDGIISGATNNTYTTQATDEGDTVFCRVTATALGVSASADSNNSGTIELQGQEAFQTNGSFAWTAPAGVTSISAVGIATGQSGGSGRPDSNGNSVGGEGGGGGGLGYRNAVPVTPGTQYAINVGNPTSLFAMSIPTAPTSPTGTFTDSYQGGLTNPSSPRQGSPAPGGQGSGAGDYNANGVQGQQVGTGLTGTNTGNFGRGGNGGPGGCYGGGSGGQGGQPGGARIMWGTGREYPGNAADV